MVVEKLLAIVGPTGVGKTALGMFLAKKFKGEIVSADSRQIYKGFDIATGKDIQDADVYPSSLKVDGKRPVYWQKQGVKIWGLDLAEAQGVFSVAKYRKIVMQILRYLCQKNRLPILVGGSGLYIKAIIEPFETLTTPPNPSLRKKYSQKTAEELFQILSSLSPKSAMRLTKSERLNKQRLIRRIEIAKAGFKKLKLTVPKDVLKIGLIVPRQVLKERIFKRIDGWAEYVPDEIKKLIRQGINWNSQAMSAIGYREWKDYFAGKATKDEVVRRWKANEWQYARRQISWFRKDRDINWFDVTDPFYKQKVEKLVNNWYHND